MGHANMSITPDDYGHHSGESYCAGDVGGVTPRSTGDTLIRALDSKFSRHGSPLKEET